MKNSIGKIEESKQQVFFIKVQTCYLTITVINNNIWHLHSLSIDESRGYILGNLSVVKIYIIRYIIRYTL